MEHLHRGSMVKKIRVIEINSLIKTLQGYLEANEKILDQFDEEEGEDHRTKFIVYGWIECRQHVIEFVR